MKSKDIAPSLKSDITLEEVKHPGWKYETLDFSSTWENISENNFFLKFFSSIYICFNVNGTKKKKKALAIKENNFPTRKLGKWKAAVENGLVGGRIRIYTYIRMSPLFFLHTHTHMVHTEMEKVA